MISSLATVALLVLSGIWLVLYVVGTAKRRLPPGPWGLPIVGHLHLLSSRPHRDLHRLAITYGPIMRLRFGIIPTVVISSPDAARELFKRHDLIISGRVRMKAADYLAYESKGLGPSPYGTYYRGVRKLLTTELLSSHRIDTFASMRRAEVALLVDSLKVEHKAPVDLTTKLSYLVMDMACWMVFGSKGDDVEEVRGLRWVLQDGARLLSEFNSGDYIPFIGWLDLQGLGRRMKGVKVATDRFLNRIIDGKVKAVMNNRGGGGKTARDWADIVVTRLLAAGAAMDGEEDFRFDRNNVKALIMEVIGATVEPIVATVEWALSELVRHPEMMKKAQNELKSTVGMDKRVEESDLSNLRYLEMVLKETMRLHTPLPILIPYMTTEACTISGFYIPRGSQLIVNAWAIGRDPVAWPDAERFDPERFINSKVDVKGHDFELIPFGAGRRGCPGMQLGLVTVRLVLAQLVHCFDWDLPTGVEADQLDMEEEFGVTAPRSKHLLAIPNYRLV